MTRPLSLYAVTAPGLERCTAGELAGLGLTGHPDEPGGVAFSGSFDDLTRANLWLRTASRVLLRLQEFGARALGELERKAREVDWAAQLPAEIPVRLRVSSRKSRLYHQRAIAERIGTAILAAGRTLARTGEAEGEDSGDENGVQLVLVRLFRDQCSISLDSSGELLHRRGYRLRSGKAPLRETLAAALLLASDWDPTTPLVDPFCGSGTIPIEAALLARGIPPGRQRRFGFERWPGFDRSGWERQLAEADAAALPRAPALILGADRDAGAIASATENAARAGVAADIGWRHAALSHLEVPGDRGTLVSNPPYGVRVGERAGLRDLYARLGQLARERLAGWRMTLLLPSAPVERETGLPFAELFRTSNGGLPVRAVACRVAGPASR